MTDLNNIVKILDNDNLSYAIKPLAQGIGGIFQFVFQKPIKYGIAKNAELESLAKSLQSNLEEIPSDNRTDANIGLAGKVIEDSIYKLSEETLREYFAKLIAKCFDDRYEVHPRYSELLKSMSGEDAKLLQLFYDKQVIIKGNIKFKTPLVNENENRFFNYTPERFFVYKEKMDSYISRDYDSSVRQSYFLDKTEEIYIEKPFMTLDNLGLIQVAKDKQWTPVTPSVNHILQKQDLRELASIPSGLKSMPLDTFTREEIIVDSYELNSIGYDLASIVCS
ncbi:DUF4393 domain-containing protein [Aerococcaceae bacterium DSM 111020]|nr:DUF4393 domain-containing protein [Aerococcaceae bacterium DSM 111020]